MGDTWRAGFSQLQRRDLEMGSPSSVQRLLWREVREKGGVQKAAKTDCERSHSWERFCRMHCPLGTDCAVGTVHLLGSVSYRSKAEQGPPREDRTTVLVPIMQVSLMPHTGVRIRAPLL